MMDDSEDPLGKISRQLSELAAAPSSPITSNGAEWTQFSGISPQHSQNTGFRNLYTWNTLNLQEYPSNLQEFQAVSSTASDCNLANHQSTSPNYHSSHVLVQQNNYATQANYEWTADEAPQKFTVSGDLGGRFVDTDQIRTANRNADSQRKAYLSQRSQSFSLQDSSAFQGDDLIGHSNLNRRGNESPNTFTSSVPLLERSVSDVHSRTNLESYPTRHLSDCFSTDENNRSNDHMMPGSSIPQSSASMSHLQPNRVQFDPSTPPPPLFSVHSSGSDHSLLSERHNVSSHSPKLSDFSPLQGMSGINLDLGTNIEKGNWIGSNSKQDVGEEGKDIYEAAMKQWNLSSQNYAVGSSKSSLLDHKQNTPVSESSKPSYSDIAKTPKGVGGTKSAKTSNPLVFEFDIKTDVKEQPKKPVAKKDMKPIRTQVKRTSSGSKSWQRGSLSGDTEHPFASSSAYSLDNFDDHMLSPGSSSENLVQAGKIRRSSGSSVGSSVGVVEDMTPGPASTTSSVGEQQSKKQSHVTSKSSVKTTSSKSSNDSLFFDPRRIFQTKNTNKSRTSHGTQRSKTASSSIPDSTSYSHSDTVLNNGKPSTTSSSSKLSTSAHQHDYINNDLRDANKLTNQTAAESSQHNSKREELRSGPGKKAGFRHNSRRDRRKNPDVQRSSSVEDAAAEKNRFNILSEHIDLEKIEEWCNVAFDQVKVWGNLLLNSMTNLIIYLLGVILYLASGGVQFSLFLVLKVWAWLRQRLLRGWAGPGSQDWRSREAPRRRVGLEENILLPNTGEDAMKRLLACKGKDPYSILGLRADSSDEDIKRYYRKQAVLVHPDKNQEPGAEEAFKVLGHAFEMIGDPSKRKKYDSHTQEANEADAMRKFADMLSELQTKLQEAANTMHCDNCGGKHRRVPVDRPFYSARFCQRCNVHHSAKEGDVWAESKMLGFYWHYYALMEGHVFDITEWMKCHKEFFQHMKANTHGVSYRIATDGNKKNRHHNQSGDANLEDIINRLFNKVTQAAGDGPSWGASAGKGGDMGWGTQPGTAPATSTNAKKNSRRRKKR